MGQSRAYEVHPALSYRWLRVVFLIILLCALCGALLAQRVTTDLPQAYAQAVLAGEDLLGLALEALEAGIWILFNLITPPT